MALFTDFSERFSVKNSYSEIAVLHNSTFNQKSLKYFNQIVIFCNYWLFILYLCNTAFGDTNLSQDNSRTNTTLKIDRALTNSFHTPLQTIEISHN